MKKRIILFVILVLNIFIVAGCKKDDQKQNWKVVEATLNEDGNIIVEKNEITDKVTYISYKVDGVIIGLLAVKDSNSNVRVVINTCQSCGGSPNAYFIQIDNKIQCQNCGNIFQIDDLGDSKDGGCNPIAIEDMKETEDQIIIGVEQLKNLKDKFENWNGPKK